MAQTLQPTITDFFELLRIGGWSRDRVMPKGYVLPDRYYVLKDDAKKIAISFFRLRIKSTEQFPAADFVFDWELASDGEWYETYELRAEARICPLGAVGPVSIYISENSKLFAAFDNETCSFRDDFFLDMLKLALQEYQLTDVEQPRTYMDPTPIRSVLQ